MRESTTTGMISLDGPGGLVYEVGAITYLVREDESFRYTFVPNWPVIDLLEPPLFQGVPGYDLSLRKTEYVRENVTPTFVSERAPSESREGLCSSSMHAAWSTSTRSNGSSGRIRAT